MRKSTKLLVMALLAVLSMAVMAGTAAASRSISTSETRITASGSLTFSDEESSFRVICNVTRVYTTVRSAPKTVGAVIGGLIDIRIAGCSGGTVTVLTPTSAEPWPIRYRSFGGTLPNITSLVLDVELRAGARIRDGFLVEAFFGIARCLYGGGGQIQGGITRGNPITEIELDRTRTIALKTNLGGVCPRAGRLAGVLRVIGTQPRLTLL